jgi:hypothetical protein
VLVRSALVVFGVIASSCYCSSCRGKRTSLKERSGGG